MKTKVIDRQKCTGCKNCELACIDAHARSGRAAAYLGGMEKSPRARNKVELDAAGRRSPLFCRHCAEPACVSACMSGALRKRADGLVICDAEKCVGCFMCVMSCPYGNARPSLGEDRIMIKCDACVDRECMACVQACPSGCLTVRDGDEAVVYAEE